MYKKIWKIAFPIILTNLLQVVYQFTDMFWIGREASKEGLAAISLAGPIIFFFISLGIGLTIAGNILVAQLKGKKDYPALNRVVGQSIILTSAFAILVSILGFFLSKYLIGGMNTEPEVAILATGYLQISFLGMIAVFGYNVVQSIFRGLGKVKIPLHILTLSVLLNFVLDPLFIGGFADIFPAYGVNGAAYSTIITQTIALIIAFIILYKDGKYHLSLDKKYFTIHKKFIKKFLKLAIPSGIEMSSRSLGIVILAYIIANLGTDVTAAYGIGNGVFNIMLNISIGFSMATTTIAGQIFGAGKIELIEKVKTKSLILSSSILIVLGIIIFIFSPQIISIFVPENPEVMIIATEFVRILAFFFWTLSFQQVIVGMFRGMGETKIPMYMTIIILRGIHIPIAYTGSKYFGADGIRRSFSIANIVGAIISWFRYEKKKQQLEQGKNAL